MEAKNPTDVIDVDCSVKYLSIFALLIRGHDILALRNLTDYNYSLIRQAQARKRKLTTCISTRPDTRLPKSRAGGWAVVVIKIG